MNNLEKINKRQVDKVIIALLGDDHIAMTGITPATLNSFPEQSSSPSAVPALHYSLHVDSVENQ